MRNNWWCGRTRWCICCGACLVLLVYQFILCFIL